MTAGTHGESSSPATTPSLAEALADIETGARRRAARRLWVALGCLFIGALCVAPWPLWLSSDTSWVVEVLYGRALTERAPSAHAGASSDGKTETDVSAATSPRGSTSEQSAASNFGQKVLAAFVLATFALMAWIAREALLLSKRQVKLYFRELERIERLKVVDAAGRVNEKVRTRFVDDLILGLGDKDDDD
jgi:hypothetical protein